MPILSGNPSAQLASRLWRKDESLWPPSTDQSAADRLGWLDSIGWMQSRVGELQAWARQTVECGDYDRVIVLGMGGSSLAASVFASLFAPAEDGLPLTTLDTTHPREIARIAAGDLSRCLFIVSSKSGDTVETVALHQYFQARLAACCSDPSSRFVIITDEGSALHQRAQPELAQPGRFNKLFLNRRDIGGRYSALSYFGLAPAALLGVKVGHVLNHAENFCAATTSNQPTENPALALGMLLGSGARAGRDKLILRLPPELAAFGQWIEQLIAESTGKDGQGLVPVVAVDERWNNGEDRLIVRIEYAGAADKKHADEHEHAAVPSSHCAWRIDHPLQIGAEFFRWEFATAIAASQLGVNPFDQPDVARSKNSARAFIQGDGRMPPPSSSGQHYDLHEGAGDAGRHEYGHNRRAAKDILQAFRRALTPRTYLGLLSYLPEDAATMALLQSLRDLAAKQAGIVATLGVGPRYLHSTGQLHKGGPPSGRFIQFIADIETAPPAPALTPDGAFGPLHHAQADGDFAALASAGAVVMRARLKGDRLRALAAFTADFTREDLT